MSLWASGCEGAVLFRRLTTAYSVTCSGNKLSRTRFERLPTWLGSVQVCFPKWAPENKDAFFFPSLGRILSGLVRVSAAPVHTGCPPDYTSLILFIYFFRARYWMKQPVSNSAAKAHCRPGDGGSERVTLWKRRNAGRKDKNRKDGIQGGGGGNFRVGGVGG